MTDFGFNWHEFFQAFLTFVAVYFGVKQGGSGGNTNSGNTFGK